MHSRSSSTGGVLLVLSDFHHVNGLNPLSSISRMRASAAASFCLSVAIKQERVF
jgi:hypothetical protein